MEWHSRVRKYESEMKGKHLNGREVEEHPLRPLKVTQVAKVGENVGKEKKNLENKKDVGKENVKKTSTWTGLDPLSMALSMPEEGNASIVPSMTGASKYGKSKSIDSVEQQVSFIDDDFESWSGRKCGILTKYTTSERLSIKTSFLSTGANIGSTSASNSSHSLVRNLQNTSVAEKVKHRLEQLDDFEEGSIKEMLNLTQQEYVNHIEELNGALRESWESDQRVKALKIAIQCAKLLAEVNVIQFYPSKFVLITDILDNFGSLVYKRIHVKAGSLPMTPESAKETCRNWFFKIASVRELIPRFYVEAAILKTYGFIIENSDVQEEYIKSLKRLTKMIRGIGDPLVATYARAYLARVVIQIAPQCKALFQDNFSDFLASISQLSSPMVHDILASQRIDYSIYYSLYIPALDWLLHCLAYKSSHILLNDILNEFKQSIKSSGVTLGCCALILNSILSCLSSSFVSSRANEFLDLVKSVSYQKNTMKASKLVSDDDLLTTFPTHLLIRNLGLAIIESQSYWISVEEKEKLFILNEAWKILSKFKSTQDYMSCAEVWIEFVIKNFGYKEINTLLGDIIKHMLPDRAFEGHYEQLVCLISKVVSDNRNSDFGTLFSMTNFMPFLDLLQKESVKVEACKAIVNNFVRHFDETCLNEDEEYIYTTCDPVILNSLTYLCKTMHDSVNALTFEDERRQIASLIVSFLRKISFDRDFEAQLNFYVESRGNFSNLDSVLYLLVHRVNTLAMETRRIVKGHHTKKTTAFVRACLAYSFITIPSLEDVIMRLQLYLSSSHVSLINACLPQTDAFLKAAITLIPSLPNKIESNDARITSTEPFIVSYISEMLSFLLVVPDHPEQEPLYLLKGLLNVIKDYPFDPSYDHKAIIYMNVLNFLSSASQETYSYHINKIESNDTLYGNDNYFMNQINTISAQIIEQILNYLKKLGEEKQYKRQANLSLEFFNRVIIHGDNKDMAKLAIKLWQLANKNDMIGEKQKNITIGFLKEKADKTQDILLQELVSKLQ